MPGVNALMILEAMQKLDEQIVTIRKQMVADNAKIRDEIRDAVGHNARGISDLHAATVADNADIRDAVGQNAREISNLLAATVDLVRPPNKNDEILTAVENNIYGRVMFAHLALQQLKMLIPDLVVDEVSPADFFANDMLQHFVAVYSIGENHFLVPPVRFCVKCVELFFCSSLCFPNAKWSRNILPPSIVLGKTKIVLLVYNCGY